MQGEYQKKTIEFLKIAGFILVLGMLAIVLFVESVMAGGVDFLITALVVFFFFNLYDRSRGRETLKMFFNQTPLTKKLKWPLLLILLVPYLLFWLWGIFTQGFV